MPTVLQLYSDAAADAGIIQPNQTPGGSVLDFLHRKFEDMVRLWSKNRKRLFFIPAANYPLTANLNAYQIGPGATQFNTTTNPAYTRPLFIQSAQVSLGVNRRWPVNILSRPEWELLQTAALIDPDGPTDLFYDFNHPISTIYVAPTPGGANWPVGQQLILSQWNPLPLFFPGDEAKNVQDYYPESYLVPLRKGLAIQILDAYGQPAKPVLVTVFQESIAVIENDNTDKITGVFGFSRTLAGPTKGDGVMPPGVPPGQPPQ